jgi:hypothetical protein
MPVTIKSTKKLHPFVNEWAKSQRKLSNLKDTILQATGWSNRTFYNKLQAAQQNKLQLNDVEKNAIATILNIDINTL